jgi:hypothetical protein
VFTKSVSFKPVPPVSILPEFRIESSSVLPPDADMTVTKAEEEEFVIKSNGWAGITLPGLLKDGKPVGGSGGSESDC